MAFAGDSVGRYSVVGTNPGNKARYSETVWVERTWETFRVTWDIGTQTFVGTGIGSEKGLAVTYRSSIQTGLATAPMATTGRGSGPIPAAKLSAVRLGPANSNALAEVS